MNIKKLIIKGKTSTEKKDLVKKIKGLGRTFLSKLVIKLTASLNIPEFYLQILKYERNNRTRYEINQTLPFFATLGPFQYYINLKENNNENNSSKIILDLAWNSFYKYKKKMSIIKRANEENEGFFLILNGNITKLNLVFKKEKLTIEEYLLYILKMKYLSENQIIYKCNKLNKGIINIDINNFDFYSENNSSYNIKDLKHKAKKELKKEGFNINPEGIMHIPSIEKYIKLSYFDIREKSDTNVRYNLYVGNYIKSNILNKGDLIGDLSKNENNEGYTYITNTCCDICYLNKKEINDLKLYDYIYLKMLNEFKRIKHKFYILKDTRDDICDNYIVPFLVYKTYKKGEKIIIQNSQYEGIYFIMNGKVKISVSKTFNELSNTLVSMQYSMFNFKEYVYKRIKTIDALNEFNLKYLIHSNNKSITNLKENDIEHEILSSNEYFNYFKQSNYIDFYTLKEGDVLGLNELYDYKTELYNFNAECISNEATLFFISKKDFNNLMQKESYIMYNVIKLIDFKSKALIGKINLYKNFHKNLVIKTLKNKEKKNMRYINSCINLKESKYNIKINKNEINDANIMKQLENKINNIKIQKNIKLFKNNSLLNYLKSSSVSESMNFRNENNKDTINEKISILKDNFVLNKKLFKSKNFNNININENSNNLRKNKSCMNLSCQNFSNLNSKRKEIDIKKNIKKIQSRNDNYFSKTLYCNNKKRNNNNKEEKKVLKNTKNIHSGFSTLPLIRNIKK